MGVGGRILICIQLRGNHKYLSPLKMEHVFIIILLLGYILPRNCTMIMSHLLLQLITLPITMESDSMPHVFLHYIFGPLNSMLQSHYCVMLNVQGKLSLIWPFYSLVDLSCQLSLCQLYLVIHLYTYYLSYSFVSH